MIYAIVTTTVGDQPDADQRREQERYLDQLAEDGVLVAAGPFDDNAGEMMLIRAASTADAIEVARRSPRVADGVDRCRVRRWNHICYDSAALDQEQGAEPTLEVVAPTEQAYSIIDATDDPEHAETLVRCFARKQIAANDVTRVNFLRGARKRGWRKLLLRHEEELIGQVEFSPAAAAGLPVSGDTRVIHCLWMRDAYTGLEGGRQLLAACATAAPQPAALTTIAFNPELAWLPSSFFERQGFTPIDKLPTGRFVGNTEVTAYLMWRPLRSDATPPEWDRDRVRAGIDFCPAYPWIHGRRLYWGTDFDFRAVVVQEGLRRPELLEQFPVLGTQKTETWKLVKIGFPRVDLERAVQLIQGALIEEPTYYAYAHAVDSDELIIIYPFRDYRVTSDSESWEEAIRYGLDKGIPREELVFTPFPFDDEQT